MENSQAKKVKTNYQLISLLSFLIILMLSIWIIFLYFTVSGLSIKLKYLRSNYQQTFSPIEAKGPVTLISYAHPQLQYSLMFPSNWHEEQFESPAGPVIQQYFDLILQSPDYKLINPDSGSQHILTGSTIFVRGTSTSAKSVDETFNNNRTSRLIARNVTRTSVDGQPAIRYNYIADENDLVVNTVFIKNGTWYLIKMQSADSDYETKNMPEYQEILNSFKAK